RFSRDWSSDVCSSDLLSSAISQYVQAGGKVLFVPAENNQTLSYNPFLQQMGAAQFGEWVTTEREVSSINTDAFIFRDVYKGTRSNMRLPKTGSSYTKASSGTMGQALLKYRDGGEMATFYTQGKGAMVVLNAPLDERHNDLTLQPEVFVPLLYKLAIYRSDTRRLAYTIGQDFLIPIDIPDFVPSAQMQITGPESFIPGMSQMGS